MVSVVKLQDGQYLYMGESRTSVEKKLGKPTKEEDSIRVDDGIFCGYTGKEIGVCYNVNNKIEIIQIGEGYSYAGYTVGGAFPAVDALHDYEYWNNGMGAYWSDAEAEFELYGDLVRYTVLGKNKSTTNPRPTVISRIDIALYGLDMYK